MSPRRASLFFALVLAAAFLGAETAENDGAPASADASTDLALQIASRLEAKLVLTQSYVFPFLQGSDPLTRGNNLKTTLSAEVSPVSVNGIAEAAWTPIAFFQLAAGGRIGSGWNIPLGNGIGINAPEDPDGSPPRKGEITGSAFGGVIWGGHVGAALQFDLAAIFPGDWNHLIFRTYHEGRYRAFTGAAADQPWVFENDSGENRNGFAYYGSYLLGYQMPASPILNMVGLLVEMDQYLTLLPGDGWGDSLPRWHAGILFSAAITRRFSAALLFQMRTLRNYGRDDLENRDHLFFQDEKIDSGDPYRLVFYRAAAVLSLKLR